MSLIRRKAWFALFRQATICYHGLVERAIDKAIVFACCLVGFVVLPWEPVLLVALLCSLAASALAEVLPSRFAIIAPLACAVAALAIPAFLPFLPLCVYDLMRSRQLLLRVCWVIPAAAAFFSLPVLVAAIVVVACAVSLLLSLRMQHAALEQTEFRRRRDDLQETSLALEEKNRDLRERQDLEVRLATLAERSRIAREIHDNVGHLITRSIMQVEALQVVHREDEQVKAEFAQIGATLHEAMDTVRASVHNLHDDAFDLETQLALAAEACPSLAVDVDYRANDVPPEVGYCFVAIVREALSNASRHSDANRVAVSVAEYPAFFRLSVCDNGTKRPRQDILNAAGGLAASEDGSQRRGIGLLTMADRTRSLGGMFRVDYDHGFKVFVSIPKGELA